MATRATIMGSEAGSGGLDGLAAALATQNGQRMAVAAFSIVAFAILMLLPGGALAYIFGLPLLFFVPGFTVVRLFFWRGTSEEMKLVLSIGLSILVVIFLGLILALTPIGLTENTTRLSLVVFTLGAMFLEAGWLHADRPSKKPIGAKGSEPSAASEERGPPEKMDIVVVAMIATALVVSGISLGLILTAHYPSRTYFAMTDENGSADINTSRTAGQPITLILHMKNGEDGPRNFTLIFHDWNSTIHGTQQFNKTMPKNEIWNQTVTIQLDQAGIFRLDFDLYIQQTGQDPILYGNLHLWVEVIVR